MTISEQHFSELSIYREFSGDYFFAAATKRANRVSHLPEVA